MSATMKQTTVHHTNSERPGDSGCPFHVFIEIIAEHNKNLAIKIFGLQNSKQIVDI